MSSFVNEHLADPSVIYTIAREALLPGGHLFVVVPNRESLSRQLAVAMGLLQYLDDLSPNDRKMGHCRTYSADDLRAEVVSNHFTMKQEGGLLLKPLADFQMNDLLAKSILTTQHLLGLEKLGQTYPSFCMSIFAVAAPD